MLCTADIKWNFLPGQHLDNMFKHLKIFLDFVPAVPLVGIHHSEMIWDVKDCICGCNWYAEHNSDNWETEAYFRRAHIGKKKKRKRKRKLEDSENLKEMRGKADLDQENF